ncbi:uncharacterized protein BDW70DRAFT_134263 [Aspergillus foveolatus]|uniref:uncharacterized protein n=1 Tax=Aspergillus foveolatus TaxID=210207 RepID=UPI003CCD1CC4
MRSCPVPSFSSHSLNEPYFRVGKTWDGCWMLSAGFLTLIRKRCIRCPCSSCPSFPMSSAVSSSLKSDDASWKDLVDLVLVEFERGVTPLEGWHASKLSGLIRVDARLDTGEGDSRRLRPIEPFAVVLGEPFTATPARDLLFIPERDGDIGSGDDTAAFL